MKMNKVIMFVVVGLLMVGLSGCVKKEEAETKLVDEEKIEAAMKAGKSMYCVMGTSEDTTIETWTKGEKTKVYGKNIGGGVGMGYMISDEEWTYMWTEGSKKGSKYPVTDEETPRSEGESFEGEDFEAEEYSIQMKQELKENGMGDYKYECSEKKISDSMFVPPTDVEFVDVMKNMEESFRNMGADLESFKQ